METHKDIIPQTQNSDALPTPQRLQQQMQTFEEEIDLVVQKKYLHYLSGSPVRPLEEKNCPVLSWIQVTKIVYDKGVFFADKMAMLYAALHNSAGTVVMVIQKIKNGFIEVFLGTRDEQSADNVSSKILEAGLKGILPGLQTTSEKDPTPLDESFPLKDGAGVSCVSCIGSLIDDKKETFVQGVENLINSSADIPSFCAWFVAEKVPRQEVEKVILAYEGLYTSLFPLANVQYSMNESDTEGISESVTKGFNESVTKNITHTVTSGSSITRTSGTSETKTNGWSAGGNLSVIVAGVNLSSSKSTSHSEQKSSAMGETFQQGDSTGTANAEGRHEDRQEGKSQSTTKGKGLTLTSENRHARSCLNKIDRQIQRIEKASASGLWSVATYFVSTSTSTSKKLASIYRGTIVGKDSDIETVAINHWSEDQELSHIYKYLSLGLHPVFNLNRFDLCPTPGSLVDSTELSVHLSLPQKSVNGVLVREEKSFGRAVIRDHELDKASSIDIGRIVHLGEVFQREHVALDTEELSKHMLVCGTTGSGKSNTLYLILDNLLTRNTNVLIIEPAKGEYKEVFGERFGREHVFGTSPKEGRVLTINPFVFPEAIDIYEHIDALVETFSACWPMYAAMPQVLKHSIIEAYKECGWDMESSSNPFGIYPSVEDVIEALKHYINTSDYSNETKGDYKGSLETRLTSLCEGQIGRIFNEEPIEDKVLFNQNSIIDLSRIRSAETKSLLMGILIMKLNEFRMAEKKGMNLPLRHVTVLEEAHNLLKRTSTAQSAESSNVAGMAVERIANGMAEMRTYGEGFIIADQSPSMLDLSTVRNTNTKIIMALPEKEDQEVAGRSIGLIEDQIHEISRLKKGEAIAYQNSWEEPVKVKIHLFRPPQGTTEAITEKAVDNSSFKSIFSDIFSALYSIYTRGADPETADLLYRCIKQCHLSGSRKYKILTHLETVESLSPSDCATICALIVGPSLYSSIKGIEDMREVERITEKSFSSVPGLVGNPNLLTIINMYFMGCSNADQSEFYNIWITRDSKKRAKP